MRYVLHQSIKAMILGKRENIIHMYMKRYNQIYYLDIKSKMEKKIYLNYII